MNYFQITIFRFKPLKLVHQQFLYSTCAEFLLGEFAAHAEERPSTLPAVAVLVLRERLAGLFVQGFGVGHVDSLR